MDFGSYPPEVNSARMYTGPGAEPLSAAAEAWTALAGELQSIAESYDSVVAGLVAGPWRGPSSESMAAGAGSMTSWLRATAVDAEQTGAQARSASAAYQDAFAATVPPQAVAENRVLLATLISTDLFGRNTHAIAANEAQYAAMWAQDAAAMYSYAATSATATRLPTFATPRQTTDPAGQAGQSAAVGQATGGFAGDAQSTLQRAFTAVPSALQTAAAAPAADSPLDTISNLIAIFLDFPAGIATFTADLPLGSLGLVSFPYDVVGAQTGIHTDKIVSGWNAEQTWPGEGPAPVQPFPAPLLNMPTGSSPALSASAGIAEANQVGALSVPPSWTLATPAVKPMAVTLPALPAAVSGGSASDATENALREMALAGITGRAMTGIVGGGAAGRVAGRAAVRATERRPGGAEAAAQAPSRTVVTGVAAELREFRKLRDEGILTEEEFREQKDRLLGR